VGFQTQQDLDGFRDYLMRWARADELGCGVWQAFGRTVRAQVFPIGIDVGTIAAQAPTRMAADTWVACAKVSAIEP
jgi:trehalose 6-phosphate synthase